MLQTMDSNASFFFGGLFFSWGFPVWFFSVIFQVASLVHKAIGAVVTPLPLAALSEEGWGGIAANRGSRDRNPKKPTRWKWHPEIHHLASRQRANGEREGHHWFLLLEVFFFLGGKCWICNKKCFHCQKEGGPFEPLAFKKVAGPDWILGWR